MELFVDKTLTFRPRAPKVGRLYTMGTQASLDLLQVGGTKGSFESLRPCLQGVGDSGLVGLVSFVFTLWRTLNKRNLPH